MIWISCFPPDKYATSTLLSPRCGLTKRCIRYNKHIINIYELLAYQAMHTLQAHYYYLRIAVLQSDAYAASTLLLSTNCWLTKWRIRCKHIVTIYELLAYQVTHTLQAHCYYLWIAGLPSDAYAKSTLLILRIVGLPSKAYVTSTLLLYTKCWLTKWRIRYKHLNVYELWAYQAVSFLTCFAAGLAQTLANCRSRPANQTLCLTACSLLTACLAG